MKTLITIALALWLVAGAANAALAHPEGKPHPEPHPAPVEPKGF